MKVTVITVCYNSSATIGRTIESVLGQTWPEVEYLIIDGNSKDNTVAICESYRESFDKKGYEYHIVSEPDKGIYDAMNKGVFRATGELVGIINSDDRYLPRAIETAAREYLNEKYDMFYASINVLFVNSSGEYCQKFVKKARLRKLVVSRDWNHPTTFIPLSLYKELNGYKLESLHDDWDLVLKIRKRNGRIAISGEVLAEFTLGGISNVKSLKQSVNRGKARYRIYRNNGYSRFYWFECLLIEAVKFFTV